MKAPLAHTNTFITEGAPVPVIEVLREGGSDGDVSWSEIQKLYIPPGFAGTFRIVRDGAIRSEPLGVKSTVEDIDAAMTNLLDPGGEFIVTTPIKNVAYIEFAGDMKGGNYPLLTVEIFDSPPPAKAVTLNTRTREMADWMQVVNEGLAWLEVKAEIEDEEDVFKWHTLFYREVRVRENIDWEELATAPGIDWLNPPSFYSYNTFAPGQVSNGQIHYTTTIGDGSATSFPITHGLNTTVVDLSILETASPGAAMIAGTDFSWERNGANQVIITWLGTTPTTGQYVATVKGLAMTSFFDDHGHVIDDTEGLQEIIDDLQGRLAVLEISSGGRTLEAPGEEGIEVARWTLPTLYELYPSKVQPTPPESGKLSDLDADELREGSTRKIISRGKGLLPAVHDASVAALPATLPAANSTAAEAFIGAVGRHDGTGELILPGGGGNASSRIQPGEFATTDGVLWYPVVQYGDYEAHVVTANAETDKLTFSSLATAEMLPEGANVELATTNTLPAGLSTGVTYTVFGMDYADGSFQLKDSGGTVVTFTDTGTGVHTVVVAGQITYYPRHFERTLFTIHVNDKMLRPRKRLDVGFQLEAAVLKSNTEAQWVVVIEIGEARSVATVGTEGLNLSEMVWRKIPALEQRIILTKQATTHRFGLRVQRRLIDGLDVFDASRFLYGAQETGVVPPLTANFAVRGRLTRFDTIDSVSDPKGYVIVSGLNFKAEDDAASNGTAIEYGFAIVK